ncbi:PadR family transcriptional regulator [Promicromonospora citrea]|uniref:PadR family transcriptional regulator n=1 Tax=Promicromonospora citrea TaxID=43677 RepID=A0A8H9L6R5_9MICO|nr:PadR family transcriptional regulator [Promicromonospora citrea]NNH53616.1 PadR family transcriptional regulator [Promicromonospora citrea]GGM44482.1 PadR family transcriptional regulator [Promicromonospora citrea]
MSATRLLVLGVVHLSGGAHGYQVRSELQSWGAETWAKIKPGSIYHALKKAAADGLLTEHAEPGSSGPERVLYRATARGRDEIVELVRDGLRRTHDPTMLDAAITMLPMLTRADAIAHVNERVARLEAELVGQAKGWENPEPDIPEHVRDQAELWAGHARVELEWAKSLSRRLSEGAYTMADDPGSWRTVHDPLGMRF